MSLSTLDRIDGILTDVAEAAKRHPMRTVALIGVLFSCATSALASDMLLLANRLASHANQNNSSQSSANLNVGPLSVAAGKSQMGFIYPQDSVHAQGSINRGGDISSLDLQIVANNGVLGLSLNSIVDKANGSMSSEEIGEARVGMSNGQPVIEVTK
jgi:hypothetical protein